MNDDDPGETTLSWVAEDGVEIEVRVDSPGGPLFSCGAGSGRVATGKWVRNGTKFFLQSVSPAASGRPSPTLAEVTVHTYPARFMSEFPAFLSEPMRGSASSGQSADRTLVVGWFSFSRHGATAGDLLARDVSCAWLRDAAYAYDVAAAEPFPGGVDWRAVAATDYSTVVFVCGPFVRYESTDSLLEKFSHCRLIGLNVSMPESLDRWNPFDVLIERDSSRQCRPDMSFLSRQDTVPVAGLVLVEPIHSDKGLVRQQEAHDAIRRLLESREAAIVEIDTRLDRNLTGLRSPAEVESVIARMDLVVTTRLHGLVLALKNGVPAVAVDVHQGGGKVSRQAETIGWPIVFTPDRATDEALQAAFDYCLTPEARAAAADCASRARRELSSLREEFLAALRPPA